MSETNCDVRIITTDEEITSSLFDDETPVSEPSKKKAKSAVKFKKAPQAPRRFKSAYMFFSTAKHPEIRERLKNEGKREEKTTHIAKLVSAEWKALPEEERKKWEEIAREDKARFEVEKAMYTGPWKVPAKKRSQKDPSAPKRPMSSFLSFSNSKRASTKQENPDKSNAEISRMLAEMWRDAPEDERRAHIEKEAKLREEYKVAMAEWKKNEEDKLNAQRQEREDLARKAAANQMSIESQGITLDLNSMNAPQTGGTGLGIPNMTGSTSNQFNDFSQQQQIALGQALHGNSNMLEQQQGPAVSQNFHQQFGQQNNFRLMNHQGQFSGLGEPGTYHAACLQHPSGASPAFGDLENNNPAGAYGNATNTFGGFQGYQNQFSQGFGAVEHMDQFGNSGQLLADFQMENAHDEV